jgi:hypothetical protein
MISYAIEEIAMVEAIVATMQRLFPGGRREVAQ